MAPHCSVTTKPVTCSSALGYSAYWATWPSEVVNSISWCLPGDIQLFEFWLSPKRQKQEKRTLSTGDTDLAIVQITATVWGCERLKQLNWAECPLPWEMRRMEARKTILESSAHLEGLWWPCTGTAWSLQRVKECVWLWSCTPADTQLQWVLCEGCRCTKGWGGATAEPWCVQGHSVCWCVQESGGLWHLGLLLQGSAY